MAQFQGHTEKYRVTLIQPDGGDTIVQVAVSLEGLAISDRDGRRTLSKYPLEYISRWNIKGSRLIVYTRSPQDIEEHQVTFEGGDATVRNLLDTLVCACMQLVELLKSGEVAGGQEAANDLHTLVNEGRRKQTQLQAADDVEFWHNPDKEGWMQSQGDHIKTWRRRYFVLKEGYLFRFLNNDVTPSSKPRGIIDLSKLTDVCETKGRAQRSLLKLSTGKAQNLYICDSETDLVEWMSAVEIAMQKVMRQIAGVDDAPQPSVSAPSRPSSKQTPSSNTTTQMINQLQTSYSSQSYNDQGGSGAKSRNKSGVTGLQVKGSGYYPTVNLDFEGVSKVDYSQYAPVDNGKPRANNVQSSSTSFPFAPNATVNVNYGEAQDNANTNPHAQNSNYNQSAYAGSYSYGGAVQSNDSTNMGVVDVSNYGQGYGNSNGYDAYRGGGTGNSQYQGQYGTAQQSSVYGQQNQRTDMQQASIIDAAPSQQLHYGYSFNQQVAAHPQTLEAQPSAPAPSPGSTYMKSPWSQHYDPAGRPYYHNATTGATQWDVPAEGYA